MAAALADFSMLAEDAIHGADRAVVNALVEQAGIDFRRRLIGEAWFIQQVQNNLRL